MKCPCCGSHFDCRGENREDYHCSNFNCPSRSEAHYYPHVGVRQDWWFATRYHLPFKRGGQWYCVSGPNQEWYKRDLRSLAEQLWPHSTERYAPRQTTVLQKIINKQNAFPITSINGNSVNNVGLRIPHFVFNTCEQDTIWTIDYMALPVNEDFNREFDALINKFDRYFNKLIILQ